MAEHGDKIQDLMDEVYDKWQKSDNKSKWEVLDDFSEAHQIAVVFGNFNYQVGNGGIEQWISNGYFHDDSEKFIEYLTIGAETDERCRSILDRVYQLDQYAEETGCDRDGYFYDHSNEDGDSNFIGDIINCNQFDKWYYEHCDGDDWWETVCGIIDKVEPSLQTESQLQTKPLLQAEPPLQTEPLLAPEEQREQEDDGKAPNDDISQTKPPLRVYIENVHDDRIGGFTIPLPTTMEALQPLLDGAEIKGWQDMKLMEVMSDIRGMEDVLEDAIKHTISKDALDELNYLAAKIADLDIREHDIFSTVIGQGRHCGSVAEIINIMENLGCFDLQPAFDAAMLGEFLADAEGDRHGEALQKLYESSKEALRNLTNYIDFLEKYMDYAACGKEYAKNEQGVFTENGYFTEFGEFKTEYRGSQDIPDAHRLFTTPGEICRQSLKFDDVDIAAAIMKLYAVSVDNLNTAADALKVLHEEQCDDYLLLLNSQRISLIPAIDAYKRGEIAGKVLEHWSESPGTQFFAVRVTDRGGDDDSGRTGAGPNHAEGSIGSIKGDFVELNTDALRANIARHGIMPDRIEAVQHNGFSKSYDLPAWTEVPQIQRGGLKNIVPHFPDGSLNEAAERYESFVTAHEKYSAATKINAFLSEVNAAFMSATQNPQPDMLRIANDAAKEILARGDAAVYKLTATGAEKLAVIESMRPMCFAENRDLAIKREDVSALDKWAAHAVKKADRQMRRDERSALKNKGEEL